jgi:hypothetical protein
VPAGFLRPSKTVIAIACLHCGHIELALKAAPAEEPERPAVEHPSLRPDYGG